MTIYDANTPSPVRPRWHLFKDGDVLAEQATHDILNAASAAIARSGQFHIVLAGGTTPKQVYAQLAQVNSDWSKWHVYLGDERCLPADDPERNSVMAQEHLLQHVPILESNTHFMQTELGAKEAAERYQGIVDGVDSFDMVLLGMGEDGHTASLFPGHNNHPAERVHAVANSPKPPSDRVSLSSACLSNNVHLLIFITGKSKHERIVDWISGVNMPVTSISSNQSAAVYCDHAAWLGDH